jgi:hypothetical protein
LRQNSIYEIHIEISVQVQYHGKVRYKFQGVIVPNKKIIHKILINLYRLKKIQQNEELNQNAECSLETNWMKTLLA